MRDLLPISALITSFNEAYLLDDCLESVAFCDDVVVVDLESDDETANVALKYGAHVIKHERLPVVEMLHAKLHDKAKNQWILILDPDERISPALKKDIQRMYKELDLKKTGIVYVPFQYYFKKKALKAGVWGGIKSKRLLLNKKGVIFSSNVHTGTRLKPGFVSYELPCKDGNVADHYWMNSYKQLFEKHRRYIKHEGKARYDQGQRFGPKIFVKTPFKCFYDAYISKNGYKDRLTGLFLALFWAWYNTAALISLYNYQKARRN